MTKISRVLLAAATTVCMAATGVAHAATVAPWTGMGEQLPAATSIPKAGLQAKGHVNPSPLGANEDCTPAPGENPVVLLHGMNSDAYGSFSRLAPALKDAGKCVYAITYGHWDASLVGKLPGYNGLAPLEQSLQEVTGQIAGIKEHTGASQVDLVGYSAGGSLAVAYAKAHGAAEVGRVVTIAGVNRGTTLLGISNLEAALQESGYSFTNITDPAIGPVGGDLLENSSFMMQLKDGGIEAPAVQYTAISTLYDESATPLSNSQFNSGDYRNIVVQQGCAQDRADHLALPYDPRAIAYVVQALGGEVAIPCGAVAPIFPLY